MLVEIANDLQLAAELIPGSSRYIGIADSQPVYIGFSNVLRLAGVIQDASTPNDEVCVFDLQVALTLEGPSPWHTLYSQSLPAGSLAPVAFKRRTRCGPASRSLACGGGSSRPARRRPSQQARGSISAPTSTPVWS